MACPFTAASREAAAACTSRYESHASDAVFDAVATLAQEYVKAVSSFRLADAFPDMSPNPYDWRVDPYEPNRVWFTVRNAATHTGDLKFFNSAFKATNKVRCRAE